MYLYIYIYIERERDIHACIYNIHKFVLTNISLYIGVYIHIY